MEKQSGRAERAAKVLSEKQSREIQDKFWHELLAPFGKLNGRKRVNGRKRAKQGEILSEAEWREQMTAADSPEELGEGFKAYLWPRMPLEHRSFLLRRMAELKAGKEKHELAAAKWKQLEPYAEHAAKHGMTVWEYIAFMSGLEDQVRSGDLAGALLKLFPFLGLDPAVVGQELMRFCAEQELPKLNAAVAEILALIDSRSIEKPEAVEMLASLHMKAAPLGLKLNQTASRFEYAEAA